ncbi:ABC transporter permease [Psychromarinibacter halotolerans]|uniref:ABC transporter permease n=1 Tax=Psychromarinibacter halotolerans TaxID=1775175 RepID=A0ABV7GWU8_9RHOB|nr:ABC transporter permease [Psychromarinibacter halotolerans]MAQ85028.1 peptide ABC transporter permease [Maritimibacter sp.]MDF0595311.1 ABC transporter permease [Psychromarinibacter halotolerans]
MMSTLKSGWYRLPGLLRYALQRLAVGALLCVGVTFISFGLTQVVPGDPVAANLGERAAADPEIVALYRERYGLDRSLPEQYGRYLFRLLQGDLGESQQTHRPVAADLAQYMSATLELAIVAMILAMAAGVSLGLIAAVWRNRWPDQLIRVVSLAGVSVPTFWLALVCLYVFFFVLNLSPGVGRLGPGTPAPPVVTGLFTLDALLTGQWSTLREALAYIALPALVLATYTTGIVTRFTRAAMLDALGNEYVRAARAKGLPAHTVILRHALRPALAAIITVSGMAFGRMLAGAVLVESVYSWPGLGLYAYRSALTLDLQAIMGVSLVIAVIYILVNLAVDILYAVIDPRIRY